MLIAHGPMTYTKAPWYASSSFVFSSLALSGLLIFGSLLFWAIRTVVRKLRHKNRKQIKLALAAKLIAILYGVLLIGLIISVVLTGEVDPVYQQEAYGELPDWGPIVNAIPYVMIVLNIVLFILMVILWSKKVEKLSTQIHYSLFSFIALLITWTLYYWNLL